MSRLHRYLFLQSLYYLFLCLLTCVGIYLLVDVFDRLDNFLEDKASLATTLTYFAVKIPLILSQILPAVFFLALVVQLSQMVKQREIMALEASGISYSRMIVFFVLYAFLWCGLQFCFAQVLGVAGEAKSEEIWDNLGRSSAKRTTVIRDVWFRQGLSLVHVELIRPETGQGRRVEIFRVKDDFTTLEEVIEARSFKVTSNGWKLFQVKRFQPQNFATTTEKTLTVDLDQRLDVFEVMKDAESPEKMSLWELSEVIERLQGSGANVEFLRTAWHMKISYAFSILVLACIGLILARQRENVFINIAFGLGIIFLYYFLHIIGGSLGENGIVSPYVGAWLANGLVGGPAVLLLFRYT